MSKKSEISKALDSISNGTPDPEDLADNGLNGQDKNQDNKETPIPPESDAEGKNTSFEADPDPGSSPQELAAPSSSTEEPIETSSPPADDQLTKDAAEVDETLSDPQKIQEPSPAEKENASTASKPSSETDEHKASEQDIAGEPAEKETAATSEDTLSEVTEADPAAPTGEIVKTIDSSSGEGEEKDAVEPETEQAKEPVAGSKDGPGSNPVMQRSFAEPSRDTGEDPSLPSEESSEAEPEKTKEEDPQDQNLVTEGSVTATVKSETEAPEDQQEKTTQEAKTPAAEPVTEKVDKPKEEVSPAAPPQAPWEGVDFSTLDKAGLVRLIELLVKEDTPILAERISRKLRPHFTTIHNAERQAALDKFVAQGNDADGFAYKFDQLDNRFDACFKLLKDRKVQHIKSLEKDKEKNFEEKIQILEELRALVDEEETTASRDALLKLQDRWRSVGSVPGQHVKTLWANYHALLDRYYDQRSIYFELKELDRRKNLEAKLELCERAEKLVAVENLKEAIGELNELHDEFKHIGPVPKADQEALWQRFKGASDQVYARRKEFIKHLKEDLKENLEKKAALAEEVQQYLQFDSDRITEWNKTTRTLLDLQKRWEAIGGLPREHAREVNRKFWGAFKGFFHNKGQFFKKLEGERGINLEKKKELVAEAEALKNSKDWNQTANKLKQLQKQWRDIGPVPEKHRNEIYGQFKKACDFFFNNRRSQSHEVEKEYVKNLKKKQDICTKIEAMTSSKDYDIEKFLDLKQEFNEIGYVPASEVKNIREQFKTTAKIFLNKVPDDAADEARQIKYDIEFEKLKGGPHADRRKEHKEQSLRREISALENDIATWKNNLEFFADSKTADKVRKEFSGKIEAATEQLKDLKSQLRALRQI